MPLRQNVLIGLSPSFLRVSLREGTRTGSGTLADLGLRLDRTPMPADAWAEAQTGDFSSLDLILRDALSRLGIRRGAHAQVVYHSDTAFADVLTVNAVGGSVLRAAELNLAENLRDGPAAWTTRCMLLLEEHPQPPAATDLARSHVLVVAERTHQAESIAAWVRTSALELDWLLPIRGALLLDAASRVLRQKPDHKRPTLVLHEWACVLAGGCEGRLDFLRCADLGFAHLADAIVRAAAASNPANPTGASMTPLRARRYLFELGIPSRHQTVDAELSLRADDVLPLMQPVVQRLVVETRQTLRFAFDQPTLARTSLWLDGPGARIPEIDQNLGAQLEMPVERESHPVSELFDDEPGELALVDDAARPGSAALLPKSEVLRRLRGSLRKAWIGGALAAGLVFVALASLAKGHLASLDARHENVKSRLDAMAAYEQQSLLASRLSQGLAYAQDATSAMLGRRPRWHAVLAEVSRLAGRDIKLTELTASFTNDPQHEPEIVLRGTATNPPGVTVGSPGDALNALIARLAESKLVASQRVLSSRSTDNPAPGTPADTGQARAFDLAVRLNSLAIDVPEPRTAASASQPQEAP